MNPGILRTVVTFQRATETQDASGSVVQTWATLAKRRMELRPVSGQEILSGQQKVGEITHKGRIRYDATVGDLSPKDRIVTSGRVLHIQSVRNILERGRQLELLFREVA